MSGVQQVEIAAEEGDQRLDRWFKRRFPTLNHIRLEKLLRTGQVRLDGARAKAGERVRVGQIVRVPPLGEAPKPVSGPAPPPRNDAADRKWLPILRKAILHKDSDVLVIDKPAGLAVQGGSGLDTSLDALLDHLRFEAKERPRLVHRLDRDTSGVLVLARSTQAARKLAQSFRHKNARKTYWAIVVGVPKPARGRIEAPLAKIMGPRRERVEIDDDGKRALTYYAVLDHAGTKAAWLALMPVTGRTHQLRAHCALLGTPILGDRKYGDTGTTLAAGEMARIPHLHARRIRIAHPSKGWLDVTAPLPEHMRRASAFLGLEAGRDADPFAELELDRE